MLDQIPVQAWLLIAIAAVAYQPVVYVYRYISHAPSRHDITQPAGDLSWRTPRAFGRNLAVLAALTALAVFIFTPAAARLARAPIFWPILIGGCALWALSTVPRGLSTGRIQPLVRGISDTYERQAQPKRFWVSLGWNAIFGCLCLWLAFVGAEWPLEGQCYDKRNAYSPQEVLAACNQLIADSPKDRDLVNWIAARGSAYYRLDDYQRALADYSHAIRLEPHNSSSHYNRGLAHDQLGDYQAATADYGAAIRERPDNVDAYVRRGAIYFDNADFEGAVADFTRAHQLNPAAPEPLAERARTYAFQEKEALAKRDFEAVRAIDQSNFWLLGWDTERALESRNWRSAVASLTVMLNQDPDDEWALAVRAEAYRELGEEEKARADDDRAKQLKQAEDSAQRKADGVSAP